MLDKLKNYKSYLSKSNLIILALFIFALIIGVYLVQKVTSTRSRAAVGTVQILFSPSTLNMPPSSTISLMLDLGANNLGFAAVEVVFDPAKIRLTGEVTPTAALSTVISKTSMTQANSTGRINITLGLSPDQRTNPPTGLLEFARLPFGAATATQNQSATLSIDGTKVQLVDMANTVLPFAVSTGNIVLNPSGPTFTPTPISTTTPTPTGTVNCNLLKGDVNRDCRVDIQDLRLLIQKY